jgi:CheY-specific phosphatase CheX
MTSVEAVSDLITITLEDPSVAHVDSVGRAVMGLCAAILGETPSIAPAAPETAGAGSDIMGIISLVGQVDWSLSIGLGAGTATDVAERFAGFEIPFDSADMGDAIGELANLLAGEVKLELDRIGVSADISLPQVLRGSALAVAPQSQVHTKALRVETTCGPLLVSVTTPSVPVDHAHTGSEMPT